MSTVSYATYVTAVCIVCVLLDSENKKLLKDLEDDVFRTAASLGIDISRPERPDVEV